MGKIKTKLIKRTTEDFMTRDLNLSEDFNINKKVLGEEMPSKKVRNQIAGYISRLTKFARIKDEETERSIKAKAAKKSGIKVQA